MTSDPGRVVADTRNAIIASLEMAVLVEAIRLPPALEMHDRLIAATASIFSATFISRDRQLTSLVDTVC